MHFSWCLLFLQQFLKVSRVSETWSQTVFTLDIIINFCLGKPADWDQKSPATDDVRVNIEHWEVTKSEKNQENQDVSARQRESERGREVVCGGPAGVLTFPSMSQTTFSSSSRMTDVYHCQLSSSDSHVYSNITSRTTHRKYSEEETKQTQDTWWIESSASLPIPSTTQRAQPNDKLSDIKAHTHTQTMHDHIIQTMWLLWWCWQRTLDLKGCLSVRFKKRMPCSLDE